MADNPSPEIELLPSIDEDLASDRPWHVVLIDDSIHTYEYVIEMLCSLFGYSLEKAFRMTVEVDTRKRAIVWTGHLEVAELKQEQIHDYGPDWRMVESTGSMLAILEQAM